jgi:hypothetical protein
VNRSREYDEECRLRVHSEQCSTCIFRPGNLMKLRPGRLQQLIQLNRRQDSHIVCHQTLKDGMQAVCRGFYDRFTSQMIRICGRMKGGTVFVEPAKKPTPAAAESEGA